MLKYFALPLFVMFLSWNVRAQNQDQPTQMFPFQITLTQTDSSEAESRALFQSGRPTVLAFWLTTCMPCLAEFTAYTQNYADWKQQADFNLVGISLDFPERFHKIAPLAAERKWPFPVYWDRIRAFKQVMPGGLNGMPQVFLFDKDGKLVWQHKGYRTGAEQELFDRIKAL